MTTLTQRIHHDQVKITTRQRECPPPVHAMTGTPGTWWQVTLLMDGRELSVPFYMGSGHTVTGRQGAIVPRPPSAREVLSALLDDANGFASYGMSDWVAEYFPDDDRLGGKIYRAVSDQTAKLRRFLGDAYETYLYETDNA
jgi:hypothetical protein